MAAGASDGVLREPPVVEFVSRKPAKAVSSSPRDSNALLAEITIVPMAIRMLAAARRLPAGPALDPARRRRAALQSAPPMITTAARPEPTPANTRGKTPKWSLPVG